jgi:hypothetical protein
MGIDWSEWQSLASIGSVSFVCGFCGNKVGSSHGYWHNDIPSARIRICTHCGYPTFFIGNNIQSPGPMIGKDVDNLPDDVKNVYLEMRETFKNNCFTSTVLLGRKLIMHIAVDKAEAKEGETFVAYLEHLKKSNYIPPSGNNWLKYMKDLGNEKNHEIKVGNRNEAQKILKFIELLLVFIYEFPGEFPEK